MEDLNNSIVDTSKMAQSLTPGKYIAGMALPGVLVSIPLATKFLLGFMALDMLTGLIAGFIEGKLSSTIGRNGVLVKGLMLILVLTASLLTKAVQLQYNLQLNYDLGSYVAIAFIITEVISIVENCARAGAPVPGIMVQALLKLKSTARPASKEDLRKLRED